MALCYYLTHPQVIVDANVRVQNWSLSKLGRARIEAAFGAIWMQPIKRIISSDDKKRLKQRR